MQAPADETGPSALTRWTPHLGTGLTVGYLALIAIGMFHTFAFYRRFGVNILDFAEPSDFLLAPVRDPLVMVATVIPVLFIWAYFAAIERVGGRNRMRRRAAGIPIAWWETKEENLAMLRRVGPWARAATGLTRIWASGLWYQLYVSNQIMLGRGFKVSVETTANTTEAGTDRRPLMLIGTTARFVFLFRTDDWRTVILPAENILRITPVGVAGGLKRVRPRLIKAMDSTG